MSALFTLGEAKKRLSSVAIADEDLTDALNEVCSKAYDVGRWPHSRKEITIAAADIRQDSAGRYEDEWFCFIDADLYEGALGFAVDGCPFEIRTMSALYGHSSNGYHSFIDMGVFDESSGLERKYKLPNGVTSTDEITAWVKKRYVFLYDDADKLPVRSFAALKAGVLAVMYEGENELEKAQAKWQEFEVLLLRDDKQFAGHKKGKISIRHGYARRPTSHF